jgi:hypothetical protein
MERGKQQFARDVHGAIKAIREDYRAKRHSLYTSYISEIHAVKDRLAIETEKGDKIAAKETRRELEILLRKYTTRRRKALDYLVKSRSAKFNVDVNRVKMIMKSELP